MREVIDAEFEVVEVGPPELPRPPLEPWSFVDDDLPQLLGIAAGFATAILLAIWFHR